MRLVLKKKIKIIHNQPQSSQKASIAAQEKANLQLIITSSILTRQT